MRISSGLCALHALHRPHRATSLLPRGTSAIFRRCHVVVVRPTCMCFAKYSPHVGGRWRSRKPGGFGTRSPQYLAYMRCAERRPCLKPPVSCSPSFECMRCCPMRHAAAITGHNLVPLYSKGGSVGISPPLALLFTLDCKLDFVLTQMFELIAACCGPVSRMHSSRSSKWLPHHTRGQLSMPMSWHSPPTCVPRIAHPRLQHHMAATLSAH